MKRTALLLSVLVTLTACDDAPSEDDSSESLSNSDSSAPRDKPASDAGPLPDAKVPNSSVPSDSAVSDARVQAPASTATFDGTIVAAAMRRAVGGFPVPLWLYKGGLAIGDDAPLPIPAEAVKHHNANPDLWTEWRRGSEGVEYKSEREWHLVDYDDEYGPLPKGTRLNATYRCENDDYITQKYRFLSNGTFTFCKYYGVINRRERASGSYEIDGYVIRLTHSDQTSETLSFVHDPVSAPNTVWVDRSPWKRQNDEDMSVALACP